MITTYKHPYLITTSRDLTNHRVIEKIHINDFPAYFYVPKSCEVPGDSRILKIEDTHKKSIYGEEVKKIIVREMWDVPKLKQLFFKTFEADIRFNDRYFLDRVKEIPHENLRKCYFDLETNDFPTQMMDDEKITCIGFYDNYEDKYYSIVLSNKELIENRDKHIIYYFKTEEDVLNKFIDLVKEKDYDMLIAHNGSRFDYPVLIGRIQKLYLLNHGRMSITGVVKRDNYFGEWTCTIGNRILFDFLGAKTIFGTKGGIRGMLEGKDISIIENGEKKITRIKRWGLGSLAQFVGMKKGNIKNLKTEEDLIQYNKQDVKIMLELDNHFNVTEYYHNMSILIGCSFENTYFNTTMIDMFLLRRYSHMIFPTRPERARGESSEKIKGATVDESIAGLYKLLFDLDQTSLYPSAIMSYNLSPEVIRENGDIIVGNGIRTLSSQKGILADAVEFLLSIRLKYKQLAKEEKDDKKAQEYSLLSDGYKILLVSFYGGLLFKSFRLYDFKLAEAIPFIGREIKEHVRKIIEQNGYKIVRGHTDSSFITPIREDPTEINILVNFINQSFDEFAFKRGIKKHNLHIELDKVYSPIILSSAKTRYVGYQIKNGEKIFKITGFEAVRADSPPITDKLQEDIFKIILNGGNRIDVENYVEALKTDIKDGKYSIIDIALPKGFSKKIDKYTTNTPWVRGLNYSNNNLKTKFDEHSDVAIVYVKGVPEGKDNTDVVSISIDDWDYIKDFIIDWEKMFEKAIDMKVEKIYEIMSWADLRQKTLEDF